MSADRRSYQRRLPHYQSDHKSYYVTFCTEKRWILPREGRDIVFEHLIAAHRKTTFLHTTIVMPDHVHIVMSPLERPDGAAAYGIAEILRLIKGPSARRINQRLNRRGRVWQHESWDHELRNSESLQAKMRLRC
jgi:putative transposase